MYMWFLHLVPCRKKKKWCRKGKKWYHTTYLESLTIFHFRLLELVKHFLIYTTEKKINIFLKIYWYFKVQTVY